MLPKIYSQNTFANPIAEGADPWVIKKDSSYYFLTDEFVTSLVVWKSDKLTDRGTSRKIWTLPTDESKWNIRDIWAAELHYIQGYWYIYYAAGRGAEPHPNYPDINIWHSQRSGVLQCLSQDPQASAWLDKGMLYTGDDIDNWDGSSENNIWAIDVTPLEMNGKLYAIWSGWEGTANMDNAGFTQQNLYIAEMSNPYTISSNRVKIASPIYDWERSTISPQKLNEGPQILKNGYKVYLIYSTPDYWTVEYKMGMMEIDANADPMIPGNWTKHSQPVFEGTDSVYSVGHGSFTTSPDDTENWLLYRSKQTPEGGWHRDTRLQKFTWNTDGSPNFGIPLPAGTSIECPAGESLSEEIMSFSDDFDDEFLDKWIYYGWTLDYALHENYLWLGSGIRDLNAGEKVIVRNLNWKECILEVDLSISEGNKSAGLIFNVKEPAFGTNAFKGHYLGLNVEDNKMSLYEMDGKNANLISEIMLDLNYGAWHHIKIENTNSFIKVYHNDATKIYAYAGQTADGFAGLRVDETVAAFNNFTVTSMNPVEINDRKPENYFISGQVYPNPFNSNTVFTFRLEKMMDIELNIVDIRGRHIRRILKTNLETGEHSVKINGADLQSGVYFLRLKAGLNINTYKLLIIK